MTFEYCELNVKTGGDDTSLFGLLVGGHYPLNPDFEKKYASVVKWVVEFDSKTLFVAREIGFNDRGEPIVFGPFGRNDGLWPGVSRSIRVIELDSPRIDKSVFDTVWRSLDKAHRDVIPAREVEPRIPISTAEQIIGAWSAGILGGFGSMSDQVISFLPNGKGYFEDFNVTLMYYDEFKWEIVDSGHITIQGVANFRQDNDSQIVQTPSDFNYDNISAGTEVCHSGNGRSVNVLFLPLRNKHRAWVGNTYGRCGKSLSEDDRPEFH